MVLMVVVPYPTSIRGPETALRAWQLALATLASIGLAISRNSGLHSEAKPFGFAVRSGEIMVPLLRDPCATPGILRC